MPRVGFEPTIPAFERMKTIHALDRATTVIGISVISKELFQIDCVLKPERTIETLWNFKKCRSVKTLNYSSVYNLVSVDLLH
jgi:hypothetical protein